MADQDQLKALRLRIDSLDEKLLELISERAVAPRTWRESRPRPGRGRGAGVLPSRARSPGASTSCN